MLLRLDGCDGVSACVHVNRSGILGNLIELSKIVIQIVMYISSLFQCLFLLSYLLSLLRSYCSMISGMLNLPSLLRMDF